MNYIKKFKLYEDTSATGGPAGASTGGSVHGGGVAMSNATTAGMGPVVSSQPSAFPGALNGVDWISGGGKEGSGDISIPYNPSGANRMFQKIKSPMSKGHGARTGKKSREKKIDLKGLKDMFKNKGTKTGKIMNFQDFEKKSIEKITKVNDIKEGRTWKASKMKYIDKPGENKKEVFRNKIESLIKSLNCEVIQIGDDFEVWKDSTLLSNIFFRNTYLGIKKPDSKFTEEYDYDEYGKIKKEIIDLIK
jgi:hypothetical protein